MVTPPAPARYISISRRNEAFVGIVIVTAAALSQYNPTPASASANVLDAEVVTGRANLFRLSTLLVGVEGRLCHPAPIQFFPSGRSCCRHRTNPRLRLFLPRFWQRLQSPLYCQCMWVLLLGYSDIRSFHAFGLNAIKSLLSYFLRKLPRQRNVRRRCPRTARVCQKCFAPRVKFLKSIIQQRW